MKLPRGIWRSLTGIPLGSCLTALLVGCSTLQTEDLLVDEKTGFQHAAVAMVEHVLIPSPAAIDPEQPGPDWVSAHLGEAVLFHDINGEPLLYSYPVIGTGDIPIGRVWVAADKRLGDTRVSIEEGTEFVRFEAQIQKAHAIARSRYPGWNTEFITPVLYSYPRFGFLIIMRSPENHERAELILDYYSLTEAPRESSLTRSQRTDVPEANLSWSFLDALPVEQRNERIRRWEARHRWNIRLRDEFSQHGDFPMALRNEGLIDAIDLFAASKSLYALLQCTIYTTRNPWHQYCQSGVPYCAAAVGRNIAGYYGLNYTENKVAKLMGITPKLWPTVQGELTFYKSPQGLNKAGTVNYNTGDPYGAAYLSDWRSMKKELQRDKNFFIPSSVGLGSHGSAGPSGWIEPAHWNALYGMRICTTQQGTESVQLITHDPWPSVSGYCPNKWRSFATMQGYLRSNTVPKEPGPPPTWPSKPTFDPGKCKDKKYKLLYEGSCNKWEELVKKIGTHTKKGAPP